MSAAGSYSRNVEVLRTYHRRDSVIAKPTPKFNLISIEPLRPSAFARAFLVLS
jgi:hypothetical protein